MDVLDLLDEKEKAVSDAPWHAVYMFDCNEFTKHFGRSIGKLEFGNDETSPVIFYDNAELIALMRNNIRALIDVAKAARSLIAYTAAPIVDVVKPASDLREALTKLEGGGDD